MTYEVGDVLRIVGGTAEKEDDLGSDWADPGTLEDKFHFLKVGALVVVEHVTYAKDSGNNEDRYWVRSLSDDSWMPGQLCGGNYVRPHHVELEVTASQLTNIHQVESFLGS